MCVYRIITLPKEAIKHKDILIQSPEKIYAVEN